jgi:FlaA1/EpsC-like NDP-sugar epimerase
MGEPVRIVDLAADLIRLSGFEVGTDIDIVFTGSRPGEKLYEELFFGAEQAEPTCHPKILKAKNAVLEPGVAEGVEELIRAAHTGAHDTVLLEWLRELVPTFHRAPKGQVPGHTARPWRPTPRLVEVVADPNDASAPSAAPAARATPRIRHVGNE